MGNFGATERQHGTGWAREQCTKADGNVGYWTYEQVVKMDNRALAKMLACHPQMAPPALRIAISDYSAKCWRAEQERYRPVFVADNADKILMDLFKAVPDLIPDTERNEHQLDRSNINTAKSIRATTARKHGISMKDMDGEYRGQRYTKARQEAMYLIARDTNLSYPRIGRMFGDRDHTTILHGVIRHADRNGLPRVREKKSVNTEEYGSNSLVSMG